MCLSGKAVECLCNLQTCMSNNLYRPPWKGHCYSQKVQLGYGLTRFARALCACHRETACSRETGTLRPSEVHGLRRGQCTDWHRALASVSLLSIQLIANCCGTGLFKKDSLIWAGSSQNVHRLIHHLKN